MLPILERLTHASPESAVSGTARKLKAALSLPRSDEPTREAVVLSRDELKVLEMLESHTDKEIARELNLSYDAVRYRIRRAFVKLGARGRYDAVHRARACGILPDGPQTIRHA